MMLRDLAVRLSDVHLTSARLLAKRLAPAGAALLVLFTSPAQAQEARDQAVLTVHLAGFRNDRGKAMMALFASQDGFPRQVERAFRRAAAPIKNGRAKLVLDKLPSGTYAVSAFHDENGNGKMDTDWLGRPREGYGCSNDAKGRPPKFQDARFTLSAPRQEISIRLVH